MKVTVYGKKNCIYCNKTKKLIAELQNTLNEEIILDYHDIVQECLNRNNLSSIMGETVTTVPQILIDDKPLQGGFTGFDNYIRMEVTKGNLTFK